MEAPAADQLDGNSLPKEQQHVVQTQNGHGAGPQAVSTSQELQVLCGPLLNYQHMTYNGNDATWHGSVLIVTKPGQAQPQLELSPASGTGQVNGAAQSSKKVVDGLKLYADPDKAFWRFSLEVPLIENEAKWQYTIPRMKLLSDVNLSEGRREFYVPGNNDSMRMMFHSCNGFSVGTDMDVWTGPVLWNDVLRTHQAKPFHVMIGGGDQIYNDGIRVNGPLKPWTDIGNPHKRRAFPFDEKMRAECDKYYFDNYVKWYSTEPFATGNASIPQINIWDDHDIIDGFGSYTDHFMKCAVFRGIGGVSFKYYCLFQHHTAPPASTFTTDAAQTTHAGTQGTAGKDPHQLADTYVYKETADDPSWIVGKRPGPYVEEKSRSLYMRLGKRIAFCGLDARTERTRHQVNYPDTYDLIFERLRREIGQSNGTIKHLILLLGVPIAYPRLAWLENIFSSPLMAPIRLLNKRFGVAGGLFNTFDGNVDLLDDLDDHYTAKHHKKERRDLIVRLQKLAKEFSVRVTILSGDVHLAAFGRFYSNPSSDISADNDHRYMPNIVSSAITNKPPPKAVANLLAKRNKIHHLHDGNTDETLLNMFNEQPGGVMKSANTNRATMPSRNYACITEILDIDSPVTNGTTNGTNTQNEDQPKSSGNGNGKKGQSPLHVGEENAGTNHPAADGITNEGVLKGGLNVSIRVEIDSKDREGKTQGYGLSIPKLTAQKA